MTEVTHALNVGDKVRIARKAKFKKGSQAFWDDEMDAFINNGKTYVVQDEAYLNESGTVEIGVSPDDRDLEGAHGWLWPAGSLELVEA